MAVPSDADLGFWKLHEAGNGLRAQAVCDGETIRIYHYTTDDLRAGRTLSLRLSRSPTQTAGAADDPIHALAPSHARADRPSEHRRPDVPSECSPSTSRPADGPPGTVRISVRDTQFQDPRARPAPAVDRLREESRWRCGPRPSVFEPERPPSKGGSHDEDPFVDTLHRRRPGPVARRILVSDEGDPEDIELPGPAGHRFLLDFDAEIPDALFRLKVNDRLPRGSRILRESAGPCSPPQPRESQASSDGARPIGLSRPACPASRPVGVSGRGV